ncbi:MAG TPA: serine/threonine-protein kinase [Nocardioides sp.]|nr:serine/threonine-protein kinase [Nocardioides sp.]
MSLPERLGRLRRVDRIGAGGFATVWLYHDDELDSPVAVKALADNWAQRQDVCDRFLEEARILRRADSDHVVRVYDIGAVDGTPYFVMSYADRGTVADLVEPGVPLPASRVVDLLAQAGDGVAVLHRHGVIHRDIKPQNLLLRSTPDGGERVMVADLGVAKAMLHASGLTQVVGTPSYMAPEQANGIGLDLRADVHALGAVGYQLLTGRLVRDGGLGALVRPELPPAPSSTADVAPAFDSVVLRALALDPEDRWPDVPSLVAGLRWAERTAAQHEALTGTAERVPPQAVVTELTTVDGPEPPAQQPQPPQREQPQARPAQEGRRRPVVLALLSLLVLLVTFGAAYGATRLIGGLGADEGPAEGSPGPTASSAATSTPTDPPLGEPAADIDFPALQLPAGLQYDTHVVRSAGIAWTYPVPVGWVAYRVGPDNEDLGVLPAGQVDRVGQVRWRPVGEPLVGGFSVRLRVLSTPAQVAEMVDTKVGQLEKLQDPDVYERTGDTIYFTYRDGNNRVRYNFFRWLPNAVGEASLEISVSGRTVDEQGLADLLDAVSDGATTGAGSR